MRLNSVDTPTGLERNVLWTLALREGRQDGALRGGEKHIGFRLLGETTRDCTLQDSGYAAITDAMKARQCFGNLITARRLTRPDDGDNRIAYRTYRRPLDNWSTTQDPGRKRHTPAQRLGYRAK